ncbi:heavy-metal-associated domain-containing protein [Pseudomonas sp. N040]|uniref:heavy-metal-associated domain-containing protein n=1 Tax=Pseudomonas sp. N040 TaxID=2785325 RepID=UPI0018A2A0F1|nr:heavy metal-associated domain-containing protein [Pseudomonas sp. N040]MBF7731714.1 heavy-metal-associated domain-containing protein [Pseudomonas sp. N040]MBW7015358.1 heavy-metal-associated domain-containing protein [Pseudomonas sp. N040]
MRTIELNVQGMSCGSCVKHINAALAALAALAGVDAVEVDLPAGRVRVTGNAEAALLIATLDDAGYPAQAASPAAAAAAKPAGCGSSCNCH